MEVDPQTDILYAVVTQKFSGQSAVTQIWCFNLRLDGAAHKLAEYPFQDLSSCERPALALDTTRRRVVVTQLQCHDEFCSITRCLDLLDGWPERDEVQEDLYSCGPQIPYPNTGQECPSSIAFANHSSSLLFVRDDFWHWYYLNGCSTAALAYKVESAPWPSDQVQLDEVQSVARISPFDGFGNFTCSVARQWYALAYG